MEVGKEVVSAILAQVDLITTLAVAVMAGIMALIVQLALHNRLRKKERRLTLISFKLIPWALSLEAVSILFGYLTTAAVTGGMPILLQATYDSSITLAEQRIAPLTLIQYAMVTQFVTFIAGIALVLIIFLKNLQQLHEE